MQKNAFWSAATNEFEHVHFAWQAQCFLILQKSRMAFSLAGARLFAFLARSGWSFFFWAVCGAASFLWGGWGWGHDNVLSFPSSLRFMLTRQWCYALGFRCLVLGLFLSFSCPWRDRGAAGVEIHRFKLYIFIQIVKLSPSDAFKVAKLHWMSWNTRKKKLTCGQMAFRHIFPLEISRNHDKTPSFKQFQPTARQRFCAYIYIYIWI